MNTTAHDFVTVDMRGLKAALVVRARAERVSVSVLVRGAVARELGLAAEGEDGRVDVPSCAASNATSVKLSIRMTVEEARQLAAGVGRGVRDAYLGTTRPRPITLRTVLRSWPVRSAMADTDKPC